MAKLTDKQKHFVEEYLIDLNATQAAIRAGYSVKNADNISSQLMGKTHVAEAVAKATAERSRRTGISADRVLNELAKIAFVNITDVADQSASLKEDANRDDTAAVQSVRVKTTITDNGDTVEKEIKLADKVKALDLLGKHLGIFNDKIKVEGALPVILTGERDLE